MKFANTYQDASYAEAYAQLEFAGTYYLAYRDLPQIIQAHVQGNKALDFGCGTGRSTRFLQRLGFEAVGVDIAGEMTARARNDDPEGDYRLIEDGNFSQFESNSYDLIVSAFTFDNIPTMEHKIRLFTGLHNLLNSEGTLVNLVSSPEIYLHEWVSFSTCDFPENRDARSGDTVRIIVTDLQDKRPVEDILWRDEAYREVYSKASLDVVEIYKPLANEDEPFQWINETRIPPWTIYVLKKAVK
ncbi:class I SAM-dependent DNA methyltransferase [Candidatus Neomarinimicrobiota bacterium]